MSVFSKWISRFLLVATIVLASQMIVFGQVASQPETTKVVGTVIASSPFSKLQIIVGRSTSYFLDDVLIRLEQDNGDLKKGQYLRFRYDHANGKANLPDEMFKEQSLWKFSLVRNESCDKKLQELIYYEIEGKTQKYLKQTSWAEQENLTLEKVVQCYTLTAGNFKKF